MQYLTLSALIAGGLISAVGLDAAMSVSLTPWVASPAPLGTVVHWQADPGGNGDSTVWYRFRYREIGHGFKVVVDYGPNNTLDWTIIDHEGSYQIEVSAQNKSTGETAAAIANFEMTSRIAGDRTPMISSTSNPLVYLHSAPPCAVGGRMRVQFQGPDGSSTATPYKACRNGTSVNFYLAGMRSETPYTAQHTLETGSKILTGPVISITTPAVTVQTPTYNVLIGPANQTRGLLIQSALFAPSVATDLYGNLVWFYAGDISFMTCAMPGGYFMGIRQDPATDASHQIVRLFDLAGTTLAETNAARVSEQLIALGMHPITAFHHEAWKTAAGKYLVLASTERILTDVQAPGDVDVIGDMILVLNENLRVDWAWDAFDHLDPRRMATLGETCVPSGAGCPPFNLAPKANDWLHGNSLQLTRDGHILFSARHQDWLIKINYDGGLGDGAVLWRLGKDGDFQIDSGDPVPWFSHQHDGQLAPAKTGQIVTVFDNGNVRWSDDHTIHSRGQVLQIDERNLTAKFVLNADLGTYSYALGAAQRLPNGNFHFDAGWIQLDPEGKQNTSRSVEVDASGAIVYVFEVSTPLYRSMRVEDLYTQ